MKNVKVLFHGDWYSTGVEFNRIYDGVIVDGKLQQIFIGDDKTAVSLQMAHRIWKQALLSCDSVTYFSPHVSSVVLFADGCSNNLEEDANGIARTTDGKVIFFDENGGVSFTEWDYGHNLYVWKNVNGSVKYGMFNDAGKLIVPIEYDDREKAAEAFDKLDAEDKYPEDQYPEDQYPLR